MDVKLHVAVLPLLVFILVHFCQCEIVQEGYCPPSLTPDCTCENGTVVINCVGKNITRLPPDAVNAVIFTLSHGNVDVIENVPYKKLNALNLEHNNIRYIKDNALNQLSNLQYLYLKSNDITGLTSKTFAGLGNLKTIGLTYNPLFILRHGVFSHVNTPNLVEIKLDQARLYEIEDKAFTLLINLSYLNLSYNHLTRLPPFDTLDDLRHLCILDLSGNLIERIGGFGLGHIPNLQHLFLRKNRIKIITDREFSGLQDSLVSLDLSHNYIHTIEPVAFTSLLNLAELNLCDNKIKSLYWEELPWRSLSKITFSNNPWDCGCNNSWMVEDIIKMVRAFNDHSNTQCASPTSVAGQPVYQVSMDTFSCPTSHHNAKTSVLISLGVICSITLLILGVIILYILIRRTGKNNSNNPYYKVTANGGIHM